MSITEKLSGELFDEANKWKLLHAGFPELADRYSNEVVVSSKLSRFLRGCVQIFWYSKIAFWRFAPRHFIGGLLLDLLGLQVVRHYCLNYLLRSRRSGNFANFDTLARSGVEKLPRLLKKIKLIRS